MASSRDQNGSFFGTGEGFDRGLSGWVFQLVPPAQAGGVWTENILYRFKDVPGSVSFCGSGPGECVYLENFSVLLEAGRSGATNLIASGTQSPLPGRFAGVIKIVRFNVQFYASSTLGILVAVVLVASRLLPQPIERMVLCGAAAVAFWTLSSLLVSWYMYDYAGVTRWGWLPEHVALKTTRWANIHAGLDESTASLRKLFPGTQGVLIDIYDATEMTEPSIARARQMYPAMEPFLTGRFNAFPLPDGDRDLIFLLFAAHELRAAEHRTRLLRESGRVLRDEGQVVLVEHLRDWANFIAFGPGFLHFHSERDWRRSISDAGLRVEQRLPNHSVCALLRSAAQAVRSRYVRLTTWPPRFLKRNRSGSRT